MLLHDHTNNSSLFQYHIESLAILILPALNPTWHSWGHLNAVVKANPLTGIKKINGHSNIIHRKAIKYASNEKTIKDKDLRSVLLMTFD